MATTVDPERTTMKKLVASAAAALAVATATQTPVAVLALQASSRATGLS